MRDKQPLMHLYSKYVIRPNAFDRDPFNLPKAAQVNKHYHSYGANKQYPKRNEPQTKAAESEKQAPKQVIEDDFETVEAPKKKVKKVFEEPIVVSEALKAEEAIAVT